MKTILLHLAYFTIAFFSLSNANQNSSPRLMGTARTFTALSRGLDAIGTNPANLSLDDRGSTVTFQLLPLGINISSDFTYGFYNKYFVGVESDSNGGKRTPLFLSEEDKKNLTDEVFFNDVSYTRVNAEINFFGLNVQSGGFGVGVLIRERLDAKINLDKDYFNLVFAGLDTAKSEYSFNNTMMKASWLREYNFSTAYNITIPSETFPNIALGVGVKYIQGFAYFGTQYFSGNITQTITNPQDTSIDINNVGASIKGNLHALQLRSGISQTELESMNPLPTPAGKGIGIDIGITAKIKKAFYVSASIIDIGKIQWEKNTKAFIAEGEFNFEGSIFEQVDSLKKFFKGEQKDTTAFFSSLPTALHLGTMWAVHNSVESFPGKFTLAADAHFGFNDEPGNSKIAKISFGAEYLPIDFFALRTGILLGGRERFNWSVGVGLHFGNAVDIDVATENIGILLNPDDFRSLSLIFGIRWRI